MKNEKVDLAKMKRSLSEARRIAESVREKIDEKKKDEKENGKDKVDLTKMAKELTNRRFATEEETN